MRKTTICLGENKGVDQLCSTISSPKSEISSYWPFSMTAQPGLCRTWSKTHVVGFLMPRKRLIYIIHRLCEDSDQSVAFFRS